jgi:hypothetical protein
MVEIDPVSICVGGGRAPDLRQVEGVRQDRVIWRQFA